jgi:hypothetical protein
VAGIALSVTKRVSQLAARLNDIVGERIDIEPIIPTHRHGHASRADYNVVGSKYRSGNTG